MEKTNFDDPDKINYILPIKVAMFSEYHNEEEIVDKIRYVMEMTGIEWGSIHSVHEHLNPYTDVQFEKVGHKTGVQTDDGYIIIDAYFEDVLDCWAKYLTIGL